MGPKHLGLGMPNLHYYHNQLSNWIEGTVV